MPALVGLVVASLFAFIACMNLDDAPTACTSNPALCQDSSADDSAVDDGDAVEPPDARDTSAPAEASGDSLAIDVDAGDATDSASPACDAGAVMCSGAMRIGCLDGGLGTLETCATAKLCDPAGCKAPSCATGMLRCAGNILQVCNADRDGYDDKSTCRVSCSATPELCVNPVSIAVESMTVCATLSDATARCWGSNDQSQVGDGTSTSLGRLIPTAVKGLTNVAYVEGGGTHSCALLTDKSVWCWGSNTYGELGDGTTTNHATAVKVTGLTSVRKLSVGVGTNCALLESGEVWCWGYNGQGGVGDGTTTNRSTPVKVAGITGGTDINCGYFHCCAIAGSNVKCWGGNGNGQIGDGTTTQRNSPVATVPSITTATMIDANAQTTCARLSDGTAKCWGRNDNQQVGDSTFVDRPAPTTVPGVSSVAEVRVSNIEGCARLTDGTITCWGNSPTVVSPPKKVTGLTSVTSLVLGSSFRCVMSAGDVLCWGRGDQGTIGDGAGVDRTAPTNVKW